MLARPAHLSASVISSWKSISLEERLTPCPQPKLGPPRFTGEGEGVGKGAEGKADFVNTETAATRLPPVVPPLPLPLSPVAIIPL